MKKTKRLLVVAFGIIFALSSYNSEHGNNSYCIDGSCEHAHELEHNDEHDHNHEDDKLDNDDINLGNNKLGINVLSKSKTKVSEDGISFGVHTMDTSSSDEEYGSIELQANYSPSGCLTDSIWSVSDSTALKVTPNAIDSSKCVVTAIKEFDGEVTISVKSKFFSDISATLKATYVGGFRIEVIQGTISLSANRGCAHTSTSIVDSSTAKSDFTNYFKVKYNGSDLSNNEIYSYIASGDLIVTTSGDLSFVNNSSAPYFVMKDLSATSSTGSKAIGATIKAKEDSSKTGSISGTSTMTIGDWSVVQKSREVSYNCSGTITRTWNPDYSYYCGTCSRTATASEYGNTCGKQSTYYYVECNLCTNRNGNIGDSCGATRCGYRYRCNKCSYTRSYSGTCSRTISSASYYECDSCGATYSSNPGTCTKSVTRECGSTNIQYEPGDTSTSSGCWYCNSCRKICQNEQDAEVQGYCSNTITTTCGGSISVHSSSTTCGGTYVRETYTYTCSGTMRQYSGTTTCSGTITRKDNGSYSYYCDTCKNSSTATYYNTTCRKALKKTEDYDCCSVCGKEL